LMHLLRTAPEKATRLLINAGVTLLQDTETVTHGINFYGLGWGSRAVIPSADVIISHCPAKGMLDQRYPPKSEHLGDAWLAAQIAKVKPRLVVSGHFHGGYGKTDQNGTTFVNCSLTNEAQQTVNKPWVVELEER
jgi:Icc-related predicted phosphoesterase